MAKKIIAIWMIILIISIPLYSASAYGAYLRETYAKGSATDVRGVADNKEEAVVKTTIINEKKENEENEDFKGGDLYIGTDEMPDGDFIKGGWECSGSGQPPITYDCSYNAGDGWDDFTRFIVRLGSSDPNSAVSAANAGLCVDSKKPEITNIHLLSGGAISEQDSIAISYNIKDSANDNSYCRNKCSGIKKIVVYRCDMRGSGRELLINTDDCEYSQDNEQIPISDIISGITPAPGSVKLCAYAVDKFDNNIDGSSRVEIGTVAIDSAGPRIDSYMRVKKADGSEIRVVSPGTDIIVEIGVGDDSGITEVNADLTSLNTGAGSSVAGQCSPPISDSPYPTYTLCRWALKLDTANARLGVTVSAKDTFGHESRATVYKEVEIDNTAPSIDSLASEFFDSSKNYVPLNKDVRFFAKITEKNRLSKKSMFTAPLAESMYTEASCIQNEGEREQNIWTCTWSFKVVNSAHGIEESVYLPQYGICDSAGNCNSQKYPQSGLKVFVDNKAPEITTENVEITSDLNKAEDAFIGSSKITVTATVKDDSRVTAVGDFSSAVQPAEGIDMENIGAECSKAGESWKCEWKQSWLTLLIPDSNIPTARTIVLKFTDVVGNLKELPVQIKIIKKPIIVGDIEIISNEYVPVIENPDTPQETEYLVEGSTLSITARAKTAGANGNTHITAKADFKEINGGVVNGECSAPQQPDWFSVCEWDTRELQAALKLPNRASAKIDFTFNDQLGNEAKPYKTVNIKSVDLALVAPDGIAWVQNGLLPQLGTTVMPPPLRDSIVRGITADFTAKVVNIQNSDAAITATADFSALVEENADSWKGVETRCSKKNTYWECTWQNVPVTAPLSANNAKRISLEFKDAFGKTLTADKTINLIQIADAQVDYWSVSHETIPPRMDRQTVPIFSQRVYFKILLEGRNGISTLSISKASCSGYPVAGEGSPDSLGYIEGGSIHLMNDYPGSTEPWLYATLKTGEAIDFDALRFNCTISIVTKDGSYISMPENEVLDGLTVEFYNMPLGELKEGLEGKIEDAQNWLFDIGGTLDFLSDILGFAENVCGLAGIVNDIDAVIAGVGVTTNVAACTSKGFPPLYVVLEPISQAITRVSASYHKIAEKTSTNLNKYCKYVSCNPYNDKKDGAVYGEVLGKFRGGMEKDLQEDLNKITGEGQMAKNLVNTWASTKIEPSTIKDSIVLSLATGCIPGIIYNLHKYRQIKCNYIICLKDSAAQGVSPNTCEKIEDYLTCKFVWGGVFKAIPMVAFFNSLFSSVKLIFTNWLTLVTATMGAFCKPIVASNQNLQFDACTNIEVTGCFVGYAVLAIGAIKADLEQLKANDWKVKKDVCREAGI